jgi:transposase-like protein
MAKRRTAEQIRSLLRDADKDLAKGLTVGHVCRKIGISEQSYYRWRQLHDGEPDDPARRLRELEAEVKRLKTLVADLSLEKQLLQEVARKKW